MRCNRHNGQAELAGDGYQPPATLATAACTELKQSHIMTYNHLTAEGTLRVKDHSYQLLSGDIKHVTHFSALGGAIVCICDRCRLWSSCFSHANVGYFTNKSCSSNSYSLLRCVKSIAEMQANSDSPFLERVSQQLKEANSSRTPQCISNRLTEKSTDSRVEAPQHGNDYYVLPRAVTQPSSDFPNHTTCDQFFNVDFTQGDCNSCSYNKCEQRRLDRTVWSTDSCSFLHGVTTSYDQSAQSLMRRPETVPNQSHQTEPLVRPPHRGYSNMLPTFYRVKTKILPSRSQCKAKSNSKNGCLPRFQYTQR